MTTVRWQPISRISANWHSQLQHFAARLERAPDDALAWQWRIQIKVLSFLIARYGKPNLDWQPPQPRPTFWLVENLFLRYRGKPARTGPVIRQTLERIADANRDT